MQINTGNELQGRISLELESAIYESLVRYWVQQGIPKDKAERSARKAILKIYLNARKEKWCLLPDDDDDYNSEFKDHPA